MISELAWDAQSASYESPYEVADVSLVPGATDALRRLGEAGYQLVVVSNQPAAAKGTTTLQQLHAVHERVVESLAEAGVRLDEWRYCFHHPDGGASTLSGGCDCRKPAPGLILAAAADRGINLQESWMVGDADTDIQAGRSAGCRTVLIEHPLSTHRRAGAGNPDRTAADLAGAAAEILDRNPE